MIYFGPFIIYIIINNKIVDSNFRTSDLVSGSEKVFYNIVSYDKFLKFSLQVSF